MGFVFVSVEILENLNEKRNFNSFLTNYKHISCCFDLKGIQGIAEGRKKQGGKFNFFKILTVATQNTSCVSVSPRLFVNRQSVCGKKINKRVQSELYLLHNQLKAGYKERQRANSKFFNLKNTLQNFAENHI